jgi:phosphohistidine phosphatase SixA
LDTRSRTTGQRWLQLTVVLAALSFAGTLRAQSLSGAELVAALRKGGYVLVMRHASSPPATPDKDTADPENTALERQLDESGRETAREMGTAIKQLGIPIGTVFSSPAYRALETVRLASLGTPRTVPELNVGTQNMTQAAADSTRATWLRKEVGEGTRFGTDTLIVTHAPNIIAAFRDAASGLVDGEALVFHPDGKGGAALVARVKIEEWAHLVTQK